MSIPVDKYVTDQGITCVTQDLIDQYHTPEEVASFSMWFNGQTGLVMSDGRHGVYVHDYERWVRQGRLTEQLPHDWD